MRLKSRTCARLRNVPHFDAHMVKVSPSRTHNSARIWATVHGLTSVGVFYETGPLFFIVLPSFVWRLVHLNCQLSRLSVARALTQPILCICVILYVDDFTSPFVQLKDANKAQEFIQPINVMAFVCSTPLYLIKPV